MLKEKAAGLGALGKRSRMIKDYFYLFAILLVNLFSFNLKGLRNFFSMLKGPGRLQVKEIEDYICFDFDEEVWK